VSSSASNQIDEKIITAPVNGLPANAGIATQLANPSRASWRTFVQSAISYLVFLNIALPIVQSFLVDNISGAQHVLGPIYGWVVLATNFLVLVFGLGAKLIALLMANPQVNAFITKRLSWLAPIKTLV
jgi:hypothetical protein